MLFVNQPVIDTIWERLAFAVGDPTGALANSACTAAKVSASTKDAYLICVYVRDAFDLKEVENVFRILKDEAGFLTAYFKADAMVSLLFVILTNPDRWIYRRLLGSIRLTSRSVARRCTRTKVRQTFLART